MNDPHDRRFYDILRQRRRAHPEALVIMARKLPKAGYTLVQQPALRVDSAKLSARVRLTHPFSGRFERPPRVHSGPAP